MAKEEETIIDGLTTIGLTKYQAMVYIALVALGEGTAYVIAEKSAVPRAKVYETLDALVEKGFITKITSEKGALYRALSPVETITTALDEISAKMTDVLAKLNTLTTRKQDGTTEPVVTIFNNINAMINMVRKSDVTDVWLNPLAKMGRKVRELCQELDLKLHVISSEIPVVFLIGERDAFFIKETNGSQVMLKFAKGIIQQMFTLVAATRKINGKTPSLESKVRILGESAIIDVEDKLKGNIPDYDPLAEPVLFWGRIERCSGAFHLSTPFNLFLTTKRLIIQTDDERLFARAIKFVQHIQVEEKEVKIVFRKVGGKEELTLSSIVYSKIVANLLQILSK